MAIPHKVQMQIIKERLKGKEGKQKLSEINRIRSGLPGFNNGPYGEIKKWLTEQSVKTRIRSNVKHQDWLGVKKEGIRQFVLVGCPSAGKSSLIKELSGLQTKVAEYEFTTLKPIPSVIDVKGADFQIVDLPGLIEGASEDAGGGKKILGIVKSCDGIILMHDLSRPLERTLKIVKELVKSGIEKKLIVVGNKIDLEGARDNLQMLAETFNQTIVIGVSVINNEGVQLLKEKLWEISGLIRAFPMNQKEPVILANGSTVSDFVLKIHKDLLTNFRFARISGKSAKFERQQVGINHQLDDGDVIEIVVKR